MLRKAQGLADSEIQASLWVMPVASRIWYGVALLMAWIGTVVGCQHGLLLAFVSGGLAGGSVALAYAVGRAS